MKVYDVLKYIAEVSAWTNKAAEVLYIAEQMGEVPAYSEQVMELLGDAYVDLMHLLMELHAEGIKE